jgi:hypothetical protein
MHGVRWVPSLDVTSARCMLKYLFYGPRHRAIFEVCNCVANAPGGTLSAFLTVAAAKMLILMLLLLLPAAALYNLPCRLSWSTALQRHLWILCAQRFWQLHKCRTAA